MGGPPQRGMAAGRAGETILDIGQPNIVGPLVGTNRDGMAATIIGAIDQDAPNAHVAHLGEGDFLWAVRHGKR